MARRRADIAKPKGVWFATKRLASGKVVKYGYYGRGPGTEALGPEGSPEFHARLAEAMRRAPEEGRVSFLIWRYLQSTEYAALRDRTRRDYRRHLDRIKEKFGKLSIGAMAAPGIAQHLYDWRDQMAEASPRQADYAVSVLGALLSWGVRRGHLSHNRAAGIPDVYRPDRREKVWSPDQEAAFLESASAPLRLAFVLALETGLSQEDILVLPWSAVQGNVIAARRLKNGTPVAVPVSPALAEALASAPRGDALTILTKADGLPFDPKGNGLRSMFRAHRDSVGISDRTFHDLRGTFVTRRRAMGWSAEETALCSGHKVAGEAGAQSAYVDRATVAKANAERLWNRSYGPNREHTLQTDLQTDKATGGLSH